ncbi:hypothetical protein Ancab_038441 [Ancistrocladus abbreviatus]
MQSAKQLPTSQEQLDDATIISVGNSSLVLVQIKPIRNADSSSPVGGEQAADGINGNGISISIGRTADTGDGIASFDVEYPDALLIPTTTQGPILTMDEPGKEPTNAINGQCSKL